MVFEVIVAGRSDGDVLSDGLRDLTRYICEALDREEGYGLGGEHGYGTDYENDVFMMHQFCWCEQDECPWCGSCRESFGSSEHRPSCYQSRLGPLRKEHGVRDEWGYHVPMFSNAHDNYVEAKKALCADMDIEFTEYEWLCTCDGEENLKRKVAACQCDWHLGKAQFRFGPAKQAPNFWHKPSGFKVWWYKWIGRGNETEGEAPNILKMLNECAESVK